MKNIIKKITATAMAFTLLGAGTAITKTIAPQTDNTITASAAYCSHVVGSTSWSNWYETDVETSWWLIVIGMINETHYEERTCTCVRCGEVIQTQHRHRTKTYSGERTSWSPWVYD